MNSVSAYRQYKAFCKVGDSVSSLQKQSFKGSVGFFIAYIVLFVSIFTSVGATDGITGQTIIPAIDISFLCYIIVYLVSKAFAVNPRLREVPITYKRRSAYTLLFSYTVIICYGLVCASGYVLAMELCRVYMPYEVLEDGIILTYIYPGANGYVFYALRYILVPAAAIIAARLKGRNTIIFTVTFCLFYFLGNIVPNAIFDALKDNIDGAITLNGNTIYALDHIPFGGLYVGVYGIITAIIVEWSITIVFRQEKPSEL